MAVSKSPISEQSTLTTKVRKRRSFPEQTHHAATREVEVLLQHSYLRARPVWKSVDCVMHLSHHPKETAPGTRSI
jgi:ATP-dependent Zn protease